MHLSNFGDAGKPSGPLAAPDSARTGPPVSSRRASRARPLARGSARPPIPRTHPRHERSLRKRPRPRKPDLDGDPRGDEVPRLRGADRRPRARGVLQDRVPRMPRGGSRAGEVLALHAPAAPRIGRHGDRLPRRGRGARAQGRREGDAEGAGRRREGVRDVQERGAERGATQPPARGADLLLRQGGGQPVPRDGARPGRRPRDVHRGQGAPRPGLRAARGNGDRRGPRT